MPSFRSLHGEDPDYSLVERRGRANESPRLITRCIVKLTLHFKLILQNFLVGLSLHAHTADGFYYRPTNSRKHLNHKLGYHGNSVTHDLTILNTI